MSAMQVEPSVIDVVPDGAPAPLPAAVAQNTNSKPWNEVHPLFQRAGNRPTLPNLKGSHDNLKFETGDQEEARLLKQGVDGISKPLY